jgi:hypothetical protein
MLSTYKPPAGHLASKESASRFTGDKRDDISATYQRLSRLSPRRPLPPGLNWPGLSAVWRFQVVKDAQSRGRLSAPCTRWICSPQGAPSRGAGVLRTGVIRHFDVTLLFATPKHHAQALMSPGGWQHMHGQSPPVQGQAGQSWQDRPGVWILLV